MIGSHFFCLKILQCLLLHKQFLLSLFVLHWPVPVSCPNALPIEGMRDKIQVKMQRSVKLISVLSKSPYQVSSKISPFRILFFDFPQTLAELLCRLLPIYCIPLEYIFAQNKDCIILSFCPLLSLEAYQSELF